MVFSSIAFLYYFLPWVLAVYFLMPSKYKNDVLLASSLFFYGWGEPKIVFLMVLTVLVSYIAGILVEKDSGRKKMYMALVVLFCLGSLGCFKYADFFIGSVNAVTGLQIPLLRVALPIGISFYTFQVLSYNIDVYCGTVPAQKNFLSLATYIAMFPQLIAGPIVRYQNVMEQLEGRVHTSEKIALGIWRFVLGLSKKVLLANAFGELCGIFKASDEKSVLFYWMYALAFTLQIYFDFSGYSDMAIGLGKILGFEFMENFNYPLISKSITEFWRRWHISLGSWFRDYLYIPLGGSRVKPVRRYVNILIVWMLTGLWHGAAWNFVIWGLYFALFLILEKTVLLKYLERVKWIGHIYVLLVVLVSFVIFDASSMGDAVLSIVGMFGTGSIPLVSAEALYYLRSYLVLFLMAAVGATPLPKKILKKMSFVKYMEPLVLIGLLILVTAYLVDGSFNPFLYFRF